MSNVTLTIQQAIQGMYDDYAEITNADIAILEELVADDVTRLDPGFTGNSLIKFTACLMLNEWINRPGTGPVTEEKIKDYSYKSKVESSSYYMDKALKMIADFVEKHRTDSTFEAACRSDSAMPELSEHCFEEYRDD